MFEHFFLLCCTITDEKNLLKYQCMLSKTPPTQGNLPHIYQTRLKCLNIFTYYAEASMMTKMLYTIGANWVKLSHQRVICSQISDKAKMFKQFYLLCWSINNDKNILNDRYKLSKTFSSNSNLPTDIRLG